MLSAYDRWITAEPEEGPCEICLRGADSCLCPSCEVCGFAGNRDCVKNHGLVVAVPYYEEEPRRTLSDKWERTKVSTILGALRTGNLADLLERKPEMKSLLEKLLIRRLNP